MHPTTETASSASSVHLGTDAANERSQRSQLLELCFPSSKPESDQIRRLAYANSVCSMFIVLACVGLKTPVFVIHSDKPVPPPIPVVFEPPPAPSVITPPVTPTQMPEPGAPAPTPAAQVVPVVAAASADVAFAVPVEGPVILKPAEFAAPPPRILPPPVPAVSSAPPVVEFSSGTQDGGTYPDPDYPRAALQRRMEGRVMLYVEVGADGAPWTIEVRDSSGYSLLDTHAVNFVKRRWHWPAGAERRYLVPFRFQISKN